MATVYPLPEPWNALRAQQRAGPEEEQEGNPEWKDMGGRAHSLGARAGVRPLVGPAGGPGVVRRVGGSG